MNEISYEYLSVASVSLGLPIKFVQCCLLTTRPFMPASLTAIPYTIVEISKFLSQYHPLNSVWMIPSSPGSPLWRSYLGVSISSDLSWASHIETVCCKAKRQIELLHRHFHAGSPSCKSQLYKSLVLPILDYCSSFWDPNYAIHVNKLESVQKLAARFVSGRWNDNYDSLLNRLNCMVRAQH